MISLCTFSILVTSARVYESRSISTNSTCDSLSMCCVLTWIVCLTIAGFDVQQATFTLDSIEEDIRVFKITLPLSVSTRTSAVRTSAYRIPPVHRYRQRTGQYDQQHTPWLSAPQLHCHEVMTLCYTIMIVSIFIK